MGITKFVRFSLENNHFGAFHSTYFSNSKSTPAAAWASQRHVDGIFPYFQNRPTSVPLPVFEKSCSTMQRSYSSSSRRSVLASLREKNNLSA
jgi:hypothetical protein